MCEEYKNELTEYLTMLIQENQKRKTAKLEELAAALPGPPGRGGMGGGQRDGARTLSWGEYARACGSVCVYARTAAFFLTISHQQFPTVDSVKPRYPN